MRVVQAESRAEMASAKLKEAQAEIARLNHHGIRRVEVLEAQNAQLNEQILALECVAAQNQRLGQRIQDLEAELEEGKQGLHPWHLFKNHVTNEETLSALTDRQVLRVLQSSLNAMQIPVTHLGSTPSTNPQFRGQTMRL